MRPLLGLLLPLGLVVVHGGRRWNAWRSLTSQLFQTGGAAIHTDAPSQGAWLRTVIQADGDVLVIVGGGLPSADLLVHHQRQVERWYEKNRTVIRHTVGSLKMVMDGLSLVAGAGSGWSTFERVEGRLGAGLASVAAAAAFPAVAIVVRFALRRAAREVLGRRADRWLGAARGGG